MRLDLKRKRLSMMHEFSDGVHRIRLREQKITIDLED